MTLELDYGDLPISTPEQDLFGIMPFVQALGRSVRQMKTPQGVVIGLNGPWGSGKSSAMNLLRLSLADAVAADELAVVSFTRLADIYLTEFDCVFRHFYSRDVINAIAKSGGKAKVGILDPTDKWTRAYYSAIHPKCHKREMFFADPSESWLSAARTDPDVFARERKPPP